ncbi:Dynein light chain, cytoplasmic [Sesamum alatum]|uniref:Dynein light chain, cytoplasmic n=1 Tax=Sesamum alatum TaxID=300844 RepID=A0AAE1YBY5_9LAMI|nr:Dynein light chain, cytoplasmic [Sesamum alatum]
MAEHTTHRCILAAQDAQSPMDPPPKPLPRHHHHHHRRRRRHAVPDPTNAPPSTIQNISDRFSKLYISHKKLADNPPPSGAKLPPHPQPDPRFHPKPLPSPPFLGTHTTESNSRHHRNTSDNQALVEVVDEINKPLGKRAESEKVERFEQGFGVVGRPFVNVGGIRKSFRSPGVELHEFFSCSGVRVVAVDMNPYMQIHAVDCARKARDSLEKFTSKTLASTVKKEFDGVYGGAWHCIVGSSFGSFVTHSVGGFIYFCMDHKLYVLLFKTAVQRPAAA